MKCELTKQESCNLGLILSKYMVDVPEICRVCNTREELMELIAKNERRNKKNRLLLCE